MLQQHQLYKYHSTFIIITHNYTVACCRCAWISTLVPTRSSEGTQRNTFTWKQHNNLMAPWKNRISSKTMKLRKSLVKPVKRQNISSCLVLLPEIIMHDAFNVILWTSADIYVVMHDDLGWKNRTTRNRFWRVRWSRLEYVDIRLLY